MPRRPRDRYGRPLPPGSVDRLDRAESNGSGVEPFTRAVELFDEQRFFAAHELFESIWNSPQIEDGDRRFWKGVTQVAVGCCHIQRGNAAGASAVLRRAAGNLAGYPSPHRGVDTKALIDRVRALADRVEGDGVGRFPAFPLS